MEPFDKLKKTCPKSYQMFVSWLIADNVIDFNVFMKSGMMRKYSFVRKYFGYSGVVDITMHEDIAKKEICHIFEDYESLIIRYPNGVPDKLKELNNMSNFEKDKYYQANRSSNINISLCHAICQNSQYCRPSLKDALKVRVITVLEEIVKNRRDVALKEDMFWENARKDFKKELVAPF